MGVGAAACALAAARLLSRGRWWCVSNAEGLWLRSVEWLLVLLLFVLLLICIAVLLLLLVPVLWLRRV